MQVLEPQSRETKARFVQLGSVEGLYPIEGVRMECYHSIMNLILLIVILLLLFGGGGFYIGGPVFGGGGLGLVLLICLVIFLMGGFRTKN